MPSRRVTKTTRSNSQVTAKSSGPHHGLRSLARATERFWVSFLRQPQETDPEPRARGHALPGQVAADAPDLLFQNGEAFDLAQTQRDTRLSRGLLERVVDEGGVHD